ncbi:hypothetical protein SBA4_570009 [Candidatus Sulfopaludibacter sp. SbA4]|nr:hypothetical protein SBA4_570009 [Candidatus Sulfopaludibacter sp. SbA4]
MDDPEVGHRVASSVVPAIAGSRRPPVDGTQRVRAVAAPVFTGAPPCTNPANLFESNPPGPRLLFFGGEVFPNCAAVFVRPCTKPPFRGPGETLCMHSSCGPSASRTASTSTRSSASSSRPPSNA